MRNANPSRSSQHACPRPAYGSPVSTPTIGLFLYSAAVATDPETAASTAVLAEQLGYDSLWAGEHVVVPRPRVPPSPMEPDAPILDPVVLLAHLAARTRRIRLGTGVVVLPQRQPLVLAKQLASLDVLSGGRLDVGIGAGYLEPELSALGVPMAERGRRTDDHIAAMRALWSQEKATYHGEFTRFDECISRPRPVNGTIPVHVGGHTDLAARRAGRLGDGFFPGKGKPQELARTFDLVRSTAREHGRDPDAIELTAGGATIGGGALQAVRELADVGVDRVMVPACAFWRDTADALKRYGDEVIARA